MWSQSLIRRWLARVSQSQSTQQPRRQAPLVGKLETLEDRSVPAMLVYVDDDWVGTTPGADPDAAGPATAFGTDAFATIQAAIDKVSVGGTVIVNDGTYTEAITIPKNLSLLSVNGRATTTIQGLANLNTINVNPGSSGVTIGGVGKGFTIIGTDNNSPGLERAAVYFTGSHSNATIEDNEIRAGGEAGLVTEFGLAISNFVITGNEFSGTTFVGAKAGGSGFGTQFTEANVPRQLVVMGDGGGAVDAKATNVTFTNNVISGTAGGLNASNQEQGNNLVTLDVSNSTISGNTFDGTTTRFGTSLRVRRPGTTITGNIFNSDGLSVATGHLFTQNISQSLADLIADNTFDRAAYVQGQTTGTISNSLINLAAGAPANSVILATAGTFKGDIGVKADVTLQGAPSNASIIEGKVTFFTTADGATLDGFTVNPGVGKQGIYLNANVQGISVLNNIVTANGDEALETEGDVDNLTVSGNLFQGTTTGPLVYINGAASLGMANATSNVVISSNTFAGSVGGGTLLGLESSGGSITDNDFTGTTSYAALEIWASGHTVTGNTITPDGSGTGILISKNANSTGGLVLGLGNFVSGGIEAADGTELTLATDQSIVGNVSVGGKLEVKAAAVIDGDLSFGAMSNFAIDLGTDGKFSPVTVSGSLTIADGAKVGLAGTHVPTAGGKFTLIDAAGPATGNFNVGSPIGALELQQGHATEFNTVQLWADYSDGFQLANIDSAEVPSVLFVTSSPTNESYVPGDKFQIQVRFSERVNVTSVPRLALNNGATAIYTSGSGTNTLTFEYAVDLGQTTASLDYNSSSSLILLGGVFIRGAATPAQSANLTLPAPGTTGSLADTTNISIVAGAPVIQSITTPAGMGLYGPGSDIYIDVGFSSSVFLIGSPVLTTLQGNATYVSGSGTNTLRFVYRVLLASQSQDPLTVTGLALNGGSITNLAGESVVTNSGLFPTAFTGVVVGIPGPSVTGVSVTSPLGTYVNNQQLRIRVTFNETVQLTAGTVGLLLDFNGDNTPDATASLVSGLGTGSLTFNYTVVAPLNVSNIRVLGLSVSGGQLVSVLTGNAATTTFEPVTLQGVSINAPGTLVTGVSRGPFTPIGTYQDGQTIRIRVSFSATMLASGTPRLVLSNGGIATYSSGNGTGTLTFLYVVQPSDLATNDLRVTGFNFANGTLTPAVGNPPLDVSSLGAGITVPGVTIA
ncbi:beta strand repeat-containing protein [Tuwongella immobilis]|uniref:Haemagluttinin:Filamentous haemagglutinin-like n=1 Tax=Tuwongella immobilis TaxID=692036 RepID=A0A6C2YWG4_9BACT